MKRPICYLFLVSLILVTGFGSGTPASAQKKNPEASQKMRNGAAVAKLKAEANTVVVYARGMCCASCGIGIRKKISKLDFVDRGRFNKGVDLDPKTQLVIVALKEGSSATPQVLSQAVEDAGYDAIHMYKLDGGKLRTVALSSKKS